MVFFRASARCVGFLPSYTGNSGSLSVSPGKSSLHLSCGGEGGISLESRQGNWASRCIEGGISRSFSGWGRKPWSPRLVMVTSGSFSESLWEVRNTVDLVGASKDSPGFGVMEEGLISTRDGFCHGSWAVYGISNRESVLNVCGGTDLCFPLKLSKGFQASSRVQFGTWGSFWIGNRGMRTLFML